MKGNLPYKFAKSYGVMLAQSRIPLIVSVDAFFKNAHNQAH